MMNDFYSKYGSEVDDGVGIDYETTTYSTREWDNELQSYTENTYETAITNSESYYLRSPFLFQYIDTDTTVERDEDGKLHGQDYVPIWEDLSADNIVSSSSDIVGIEGGGKLEIDSGTNSYGIDDVKAMAMMAYDSLKKAGDEFVLLPNVAKFITMKLEREGYADEVVIEILDDVEVSGVLKQDNIYFVKAEKFISGNFAPARIPFFKSRR